MLSILEFENLTESLEEEPFTVLMASMMGKDPMTVVGMELTWYG